MPINEVIIISDEGPAIRMDRFSTDGEFRVKLVGIESDEPKIYQFNCIDRRKIFIPIAEDLAPGSNVLFTVQDAFVLDWFTTLVWDLSQIQHKVEKVRRIQECENHPGYLTFHALVNSDYTVKVEPNELGVPKEV